MQIDLKAILVYAPVIVLLVSLIGGLYSVYNTVEFIRKNVLTIETIKAWGTRDEKIHNLEKEVLRLRNHMRELERK